MQNTPSNDPRALRCDIIIGTRPEAIKLAPVVKAVRESGDDFFVRLVTSGQHGEICRSALAAFGLTADSALDIESNSGSLADTAGNVLRAFGRRFEDSRPDLILVQGDTTTAMAGALAGFYANVPVAHVEAGLRSGDLANPFPERPIGRSSMRFRQSCCRPLCRRRRICSEWGSIPRNVRLLGT